MKKRELLLMVSAMVVFFNGCSSIDTKGDINSSNAMGKSALIEAVENSKGSVPILLENGANVNVRDMWMSKRKSALMLAVENYMPIEIIEMMIAKGADLNIKDDDGNTVLLTAVQRNNIAAVNLLVEKGAEKNR